MRTVSTIEVLLSLAEGQRVGELRRTMSRAAYEQSVSMGRNFEMAQDAALLGISEQGLARQAAWAKVLDSTSGLLAVHEMLGQLGGLGRRAEELSAATVDAAGQLLDLELLDLPAAMVPPGMEAQRAALQAAGGDPTRFSRSLLGPATPVQVDAMGTTLKVMTRLRLKALHAVVLGGIRDAAADPAAATEQQVSSLTEETLVQVRALRDHAQDAAGLLARRGATAAFTFGLWAALFRFEEWLFGAAPRFAAVAAAATARVEQGPVEEAERWSRRAAKVYDGLRHGLAFDSGVRAVLLACASADQNTLAAFAATRDLPVSPTPTDHVHSSLAGVAKLDRMAPVEVQGVVTAASFRVGGPSNRTVLTLEVSGDVRVLVPHVASDSFGVTEGVWLQVRGHAYPDGKDDLAGPVVMAGRVTGGLAARSSFADALVLGGRSGFALRPAGLDLVAGRAAGSAASLNEIARLDRSS